MRYGHILSLTLAFCVPAIAGTATARAQAKPETVARQWLAAFNAGDMAKAGALNSPSGTSIIDEFAPYTWTGAKAFSDWAADFGADAKARGITDPTVVLAAPIVQNLTATQAYLIFPAVYTYKQKGVAMRETARHAIVLRKEGSDWKVAAWTWTGTVPKPAKPAS